MKEYLSYTPPQILSFWMATPRISKKNNSIYISKVFIPMIYIKKPIENSDKLVTFWIAFFIMISLNILNQIIWDSQYFTEGSESTLTNQ